MAACFVPCLCPLSSHGLNMPEFAICHCSVVNEVASNSVPFIPSLIRVSSLSEEQPNHLFCICAVPAIVSHWTHNTQIKLICAAL